MSYIRAMSSLAGKAFTSNNRLTFGSNVWPQTATIGSIRLINIFEKLSLEKTIIVPKRPTNGYTIFFKELSPKVKAENPGLRVPELARIIAKEWNGLDNRTKEEYVEKGKNNLISYKAEKEKFMKTLTEEQLEKLKTQSKARKRSLAKYRLKAELKKLGFPVRSQTAYNLYMKEYIAERPVDKEHMRDRFKQMGIDWRKLSDEEKVPFLERAKVDKLRFLSEMENWKTKIAKQENDEILKKLIGLRARAYIKSMKSIPVDETQKVKKKTKKKSAKTRPKTKLKAKSTKAKTKSKSKATKTTSKKKKVKTQTKKKESASKRGKKSPKTEEKPKTDEVVDETSSSSSSSSS